MIGKSITILLLLVLAAGCQEENPDPRHNPQSQVTLSIVSWEKKSEKSFGRNGETYIELLAYCTVTNMMPKPIVFDNVRVSFYVGSSRVCGATVYLDEGEVMMLYSNTSDFRPPSWDPVSSLTIPSGGSCRIPIQSSNCDFANKRNRRVVVSLYNGDHEILAPFQMSVPNGI